MFSAIVKHRESNSQLIRLAISLVVVEFFSLSEYLILRLPGALLFALFRHILPLFLLRIVLFPFGTLIWLAPPSMSHVPVYAVRVWNWPEMLRRFCGLFSYDDEALPSSSLYCYLAEGIVFARANRLERPRVLLGAIVQNAFASPAIQSNDNPTAINSPILLSLLSLLVDRLVLNRKWLGSETECLQMAIWFPATASETTMSDAKPIYVFCHGGAYCFGQAAQGMHDAREWLCSNVEWLPAVENNNANINHQRRRQQKDCIVCVIQYRLGVLGCLQGVPGVEPNLLLRDVEASLKWIDAWLSSTKKSSKSQVCLIGQSAGGMIVSVLAARQKMQQQMQNQQQHKPLFKTAVIMSGAALHVHGKTERAACGEIMMRAIRSTVGGHNNISSNNQRDEKGFDYRSALLNASCNELMTIQSKYNSEVDHLYRSMRLETRYIPFNLCIDGDNDDDAFIPVHPQRALRRQNQQQQQQQRSTAAATNAIRLLATTTGSEYNMFTLKHQQPEIMADKHKQTEQARRRVFQFVSASSDHSKKLGAVIDEAAVIREEGKDGFVERTTEALHSTYVALWNKGRLDARHQIAGARSESFPGKLWAAINNDWVFRIPNEVFAQDFPASQVRLLRNDVPCDLVPAMSAPHTADVSYLFGSLYAFPHLVLTLFATCPQRRKLGQTLRSCVMVMHETSDEELEAVWPVQHQQQSTNTSSRKSAATRTDPSDCFWISKQPLPVHVVKIDQNNSVDRSRNALGLFDEEAERRQEREMCNAQWEPVMRELLRFRDDK